MIKEKVLLEMKDSKSTLSTNLEMLLFCPITNEKIHEFGLTECFHHFEYRAFLTELRNNGTCPVCGHLMPKVIMCRSLTEAIDLINSFLKERRNI